jgi:glycosyltransferase involved in cell wall biosynthesis
MPTVISVVIPTRNRVQYLMQAVNSVLRVGNSLRSGLKLDIVVVDDGSTDDTSEAVRALPVRYLHCPQRGVSAARNLGIHAAHGQYLAFLDDDDVWLDGHLEDHCRILEERPEIGMVYAQGILTDANLVPVWTPSPDPLPADGDLFPFLLRRCIQLDTVLIRKSILDAAGYFDESLTWSEDWDLELRIASRYPCAGIQRAVALWRQWDRSTTTSGDQAEYWRRRYQQTLAVVLRGAHLRQTTTLSRMDRLRLSLPIQGWHAFQVFRAAQQALAAGNRTEAWRCLTCAMAIAPLHSCFRISGYWRSVLAATLPRART